LAAREDDGTGFGASAPQIKVRIESLSDLVFGLALSIGSLFLVNRVPQTSQDLEVNVLLFGFGFLIVVLTWLGYSRAMAVLPVEAPFALYTNLVLLFVVALEPYLFYVLETGSSAGLANSASVAYALDLGGMFLLQGALAQLVVRQQGHPAVVARFRRRMKVDVVVAAVFFVSALPVFWTATPIGALRFYLWSTGFLSVLAGRPIRKPKKK
jgi:uncharacterized membrane protein